MPKCENCHKNFSTLIDKRCPDCYHILYGDDYSKNCKTMAFRPLKIKPFSDVFSRNLTVHSLNEYKKARDLGLDKQDAIEQVAKKYGRKRAEELQEDLYE